MTEVTYVRFNGQYGKCGGGSCQPVDSSSDPIDALAIVQLTTTIPAPQDIRAENSSGRFNLFGLSLPRPRFHAAPAKAQPGLAFGCGGEEPTRRTDVTPDETNPDLGKVTINDDGGVTNIVYGDRFLSFSDNIIKTLPPIVTDSVPFDFTRISEKANFILHVDYSRTLDFIRLINTDGTVDAGKARQFPNFVEAPGIRDQLKKIGTLPKAKLVPLYPELADKLGQFFANSGEDNLVFLPNADKLINDSPLSPDAKDALLALSRKVRSAMIDIYPVDASNPRAIKIGTYDGGDYYILNPLDSADPYEPSTRIPLFVASQSVIDQKSIDEEVKNECTDPDLGVEPYCLGQATKKYTYTTDFCSEDDVNQAACNAYLGNAYYPYTVSVDHSQIPANEGGALARASITPIINGQNAKDHGVGQGIFITGKFLILPYYLEFKKED